ncbi:AzlC family ABC transporter permease [Granulosicoccus sp. 3-233]|uniref:AzlC family ABC transporter permease n=1 Tax=Granulosicoccus sp. 3-233 TaxID=3417969 RepID=UPI003D347B46
MSNASSEFWSGARDTIPVVVGAIPFGILFGALAINAGLSIAATLGMSLFVFAGSSQFVAAGLVAQGAGILVIVLTTFVVNLRHALYSASLGPYLSRLPQRWLIPLGFWLTDETFAVVVQRYARGDDSPFTHWYHLGSSMAMYSNWLLCTVIGMVAGTQLQGMANWGLEFAMVVTFIGIVVPLLQNVPMILCAVVAGAVSLLLREWPNQLGLMLGSLTGIAIAMLVEVGGRRTTMSKSRELPS